MSIGKNWEVLAENRNDRRKIVYNEQINQVIANQGLSFIVSHENSHLLQYYII